LYAVRDVTGTVSSLPLIAASIMSKKLAEGLSGLLLDVKCGNGAFLETESAALELGSTMVALGTANGCPATALVTAMDRPLGRAIGNALEREEALLTLEGEGPDDVLQLTKVMAAEMLVLAGIARPEALKRIDKALANGGAKEKFAELIAAQGGNPEIVEDP